MPIKAFLFLGMAVIAAAAIYTYKKGMWKLDMAPNGTAPDGTKKITDVTSNKQVAAATQQEPLATGMEADQLIAKGIDSAKKAKIGNAFSALSGTDATPRNNFKKKFLASGITMNEYNAVAKFLDNYGTSESNTLSKLSSEEVARFKSAMNKLFPRI